MELSLHSLSLMMKPRTFLLHHFGRIAYSRVLAYLGIYSDTVLIISVHVISHKAAASHSTEDE